MSNNLDKGQQSHELEVMKTFQNQKISQANTNKMMNLHQGKEQVDKIFYQNKTYFNGMKSYSKNNKDFQREPIITLISYQSLKEQIQHVKFNLDQNQLQISINQLDHILINSRNNIIYDNQKLLYVEVLNYCNKQIDQYLRQDIIESNESKEQTLYLQLAQTLLSKCQIWTQLYEYEPLMKVNTLINQAKLYRLQQKIVLSLETFVDAFGLIMSSNFFMKYAEMYFYLAQLNGQIGQHVKAIDFSKKALEQCKKDIQSKEGTIKLQQLHQQNLNNKLSSSIINANNQQIQKGSSERKEKNFESKNQKNFRQEEISCLLNEEQFYFWNDFKIINLIRCYEILALEEEHFENFEESFKLHQKAVSETQEKFGVDHKFSQKQLQKFINFQKRQVEFEVQKKQNLINQFKHLNIKPTLQKDLKEKTFKYGNKLSLQFTQSKVSSHENLFSPRKTSPKNILQKYPYNERIIPCQSLTSRTSRNFRNRSEESLLRKNVVVVRQKKLNLESLPYNLKVNEKNYTLPTQSSMFTSSTATTTKNQNNKNNPFMSSFISKKLQENSISIFEGDTIKLRNLLIAPALFDNRNFKESYKINEFNQNQDEQNLKQIGSSTSLFNEGLSNYPPPRLRSGKSTNITPRQKSPSIDLIKSEKIKNLIENKISQQNQLQPQQEAQTTRSYQQGALLKKNLISPRKNYLTKSYLQTFVDQIKTNWNQVNQQCHQINFIRQNQSPQRELLLTQQKPFNTEHQNQSKPSPQYCEVAVPAMCTTYGYLKNMNNFDDQNEIQSCQIKKNLMILPNQNIFCKNQSRQKKINYDQKELLYQQLQTKLKTEDQTSNQNNNNDHCSTTITNSNHSNSIHYFPNHIQEKANEPQRKKSYSINNSSKVKHDETQQDSMNNLQDKNGLELIFEKKVVKIKQKKNEEEINMDELEEVEGQIKFFLNKIQKMIQIEFFFQSENAFQNNNTEKQILNKNNHNLINVNCHFLHIDNLFSLNQVFKTNKRNIMQQICDKIITNLLIEAKSNQIIINLPDKNITNKLIKILEIPDDFIFYLIQKDQQNSIILNQDQANFLMNTLEGKKRSSSVAIRRSNSNNQFESKNKAKININYENQANKQVVCSFFTKIYPKNQPKQMQQKQQIENCFAQNQQKTLTITNYQQINKQDSSPQANFNCWQIQNNNLLADFNQEAVNLKNKTPHKVQNKIPEVIKTLEQDQKNKRKNYTNSGYQKINHSDSSEKIKLSESSYLLDDLNQQVICSQKNLKFISYYEVPSFLDNSFTSNKNCQIQQEEQKNA